MTNKELETRLIRFGVSAINFSETLKPTNAANHLAKQLLRSGTACPLNYGEALGGESLKDFIHKIKLVLKELRETFINLRMILEANLYENSELIQSLLKETNELISIFVATVNTTQRKLNNQLLPSKTDRGV